MSTNDDTRAEMTKWRAQLQAVELCRAMATGDADTTAAILNNEASHQLLGELAAALAGFAVAIARHTAAIDDRLTVESIFGGLHERAATGLAGTAEIHKLTNPTNEQE